MLTVSEVSKLTGVSARTLHYYDEIGLLYPSATTEAGYRLYDDAALERLSHIMLFRELEFPLKEIRGILDSDSFDRNIALEQQITLLTMKKEHIENLISYARGIQWMGEKDMDFSAFDTKKMDEYAAEAKEKWGNTDAYKEYEKKATGLSKEEKNLLGIEMMEIFKEFGQMRTGVPTDEDVQAQVKKLQTYITEHYYTCTNEILAGLGKMYVGDERMMRNIDKSGGEGTAAFVSAAIEIYCK